MKFNLYRIFIFILGFHFQVNAQYSYTLISNPDKKYYLHFYIHEQKFSDDYVNLNASANDLKIYNGKSLPAKSQDTGTILVFRAFFKIDRKLAKTDLSFHIGALNYPCRIFCNGNLLYALGSFKDQYTSRLRFASGVMLPPKFLKYDSVNELSIQIYHRYKETTSLGKIFISSKRVVDTFTFSRNFISLNLIQATLIVSIILSIYFLFLFIIKQENRKLKYLFFAISCIFLGLGYTNIAFSFNYVNELLIYRISRTSLPIACLFLVYYAIASTRVLKLNKTTIAVFAIPILVFIVLFLVQDSVPGIEKIFKVFVIVVNIPYLLFVFTLVVIKLLITRRLSYFAFVLGFIVLLVAIGADTKNYIENLTPYTWGVPHGFLVFIVVVFFILSIEQTKAFNLSIERGLELQEIKDGLERTVEERTALIKSQNEELKAQSEDLERANYDISNQKNVIEKSHKNITDSVLYASLIQKAALPGDDIIEMILPNHFILNQPCNIVGGDFYFIRQIRNHTVVCAIDCTGHGIPGAFLSMLGTALLNEIVLRREIIEAGKVLEELRNQIKISLQQTGKVGERQEGMDIAFASINLETMIMSFAGAHNPLWLFRPISENHTFEFIELPADHQSVSISYKEKPFNEYTFKLRTGDVFYLFTDGYVSQFNDKNTETFKNRRFIELLSEIHHLPMVVQKEILEQKFEEWKGNTEQTDDVLVIGVKV